ncbi:MAG: TetR/AcrR family transcriptional regulator [Solirubrobacteraceae bacterium]|nr:TetR/AcrR family transcriptional regulator [Solirubrobacteraceae bacterium]
MVRLAPPRERILAAADRLFTAQGIRAVGIDAILRESGCAKATLYVHFHSKDGLIAAYLAARAARLRERLGKDLRAEPDPRRRPLAFFEVLAALAGERDWRGDPLLGAAVENCVGEPAQAEALTEHRDWLRVLLPALAREAGAADPATFGAQLLLLHDGVMAAMFYGNGTEAALQARGAAAGLL